MRGIQAKAGIFLSLFVVAALGVFLFLVAHTQAAINQQINFQGKLTNTDGTNVTNGSYSIVFSLYTVSSGGTADWTETQGSVTVTDGIFQVALGSVTPLPGSVNFNGSTIYLGVKVGADAEMTPRIRLSASPYAFNSDAVDGLDSTSLVQLAQGLQTDSSTTNTSIAINKTGTTAKIFDLQRSAASVLTVNNDGSALFQNQANSTTGFQILNSLGYTAINIDTTPLNSLITNGNIEGASISNWATKAGTATLTRDTTDSYIGNASFKAAFSTTAINNGVKYTPSPVFAAVTYTVSFSIKQTAGTAFGANLSVGWNNGADTNCTLSPSLADQPVSTTGWSRYSCSFTGSTGATDHLYWKQADAPGVARTFFIDALQVETGSVATVYRETDMAINSVVASPLSIRNATDSTAALNVENAAGLDVFGIDTSGLVVHVGSNVTDTSQVLLQVDSFDTFADTATCSTTNNQGGIYYNTKSNSIRACVNGGWEDLVSTAGLGLQLFGVVPDSGANPGDLAAVAVAANNTGPCKVSTGTNTQTISWTACTAYSAGRKVIVAAGTAATVNGVAGQFQHLCLTGTNGQPVLSTTGTEVANLATVSMPSVTAPILCLADVKFAAANNTMTQIYDTRTYTTTDKIPVTVNSAAPLGSIVVTVATKGQVQTVAAINSNKIAGVLVATTGAAQTTSINGILAISGPAAVKSITGTNVVNDYIATSGTAAYAISVVQKPVEAQTTIYNILGNTRTVWTGATACAANSDACAGSILTYIDKR